MPKLPKWVWVAAFLICWPSLIFSKELSAPTPVVELFEAAITHGGYKDACLQRGGCPMPVVEIAHNPQDNVAGWFTWWQPTTVKTSLIHVPGTLQWNATLVHEFVHYLQYLTGKLGPQTPCEGIVAAEMEAYKAAETYLATFGVVKDWSSQRFMLSVMCLNV